MQAETSRSVLAFTLGADKLALAMNLRLQRERNRAMVLTSQQGHTIGPWMPFASVLADEGARCGRCLRSVVITLGNDPALSGSALTEGCSREIR